ncbi:MAG: hypothetical protein JOZ08_15025, partial [Verrucomicrobia bacterium]|nr:hypothetical protein [Verrucomicrobiota bacterium]
VAYGFGGGAGLVGTGDTLVFGEADAFVFGEGDGVGLGVGVPWAF